MMQLSSSANLLLPTGKGFFNLAGGSLGRRPRSTTRAQEAASLIDETLSFFVNTTGKDEVSLRQQLTNQKCEESRRSRDHWKTRAEEVEQFQRTKEDAWRLFERQPGVKRKTRAEFEEEFKRKVMDVMSSSRSEREKMVQKWSSEMQKVVQPEERRRGTGRFQLPTTTIMGENSGTEDPRPITAPCARELSLDVRVDIELNAPVSSVETKIRFGRYRGWHESRERDLQY